MTTPDLFDTTTADTIVDEARRLFAGLAGLGDEARIEAINEIRLALHKHSPMRDEPVDCVLWVQADTVAGNDYNPNVVAPPEMRLLQRSIEADGFTQPIVVWKVEDAGFEVVDGFHRHKVGKSHKPVAKRLNGRLPVAVVNADRTGLDDRMASTVRHNRARGVHTVDGMGEVVVELARRGKSDLWISAELGMDADEVRRLRQVGGIAELFAEEEFSEAWEAADPWNPAGAE